LKFLDIDKNSFTLRFVIKERTNPNDTPKGPWILLDGQLKLSVGKWHFSKEGFVLCYAKYPNSDNPDVKLTVHRVLATGGAFRTEGPAWLEREWAIDPKSGGTFPGGLHWQITS
jgi:hypothetical protein